MSAIIMNFDEKIMDLKTNPCPFCGSDKTAFMFFSPTLFGPMRYYSHCLDCKARGPIKDWPDLAVQAWNAAGGKHE